MFETHNLKRVSPVASETRSYKKNRERQETPKQIILNAYHRSRVKLAPTRKIASDKKSAEIPQAKTLAPTGRDYKRMSNAISCQ